MMKAKRGATPPFVLKGAHAQKMARGALEITVSGHMFGRGGRHARRPPGPAFKRRLSEPVV
ncbi:hypothetical protein [Burkholderia sp. MSMB1589WGS]|uniref:hypothetical protein n=1 Tax=Burkholderia sp. MSMB1589WGS TaxID=1636425 RepID=UPI000A5DAE1E|nr:hypothetical protein [Burkholderia sp. MSMB1589WGS]